MTTCNHIYVKSTGEYITSASNDSSGYCHYEACGGCDKCIMAQAYYAFGNDMTIITLEETIKPPDCLPIKEYNWVKEGF